MNFKNSVSSYSLFLFFLFIAQNSLSQINIESKLVEADSLLNLKQKENACELLDQLIRESFVNNDWLAVIKAADKRVRQFKDENLSILFLTNDTIQFALNNLREDEIIRAKFNVLLGYYYDESEAYAIALNLYEKALLLYEQKNEQGLPASYTYHSAGQNALSLIDYEKAKSYLHSALRTDTINKTYHASAYAHLCMANTFLRNFPLAIQNYEDGIMVAKRSKDVFILNRQAAIAFAKWGRSEEAIEKLKKNEELLQIDPKFYDYHIGDHLKCCSEVYGLLGEENEAIRILEKSIGLNIQNNKSEKQRTRAKLYVRLGDFYYKQKKYAQALQSFHSGMQQVFREFNNQDILSNPPLSQVGRESFMMTTAKRKAQTYLKLYELDQNPKWLLPAAHCFDIVFSGAENLRQTFSDEDTKFYLEHFNAKSLEQAIYLCYLLSDIKKDSSFIKNAYHFSEQHKSLVLRDAIIKNRSLAELGVPDTIIKKEKELIEKVVKAKMETTNGNEGEALSQAQNNYTFFYNNLKNTYPEFTKRIQQRNHTDIAQIQSQLLDENTALLQFHWGDENVFVFRIEKEGFELSKIPRSELDKPLDNFLKLLPDRAAQEANPDQYFQLAHRLFQALLGESIRELDENVNQLVVVPDGALSSLPFEALLSNSYSGAFANAPYLIKQLSFKYAYSPSLILQESVDEKNLKGVLAIAPGFENGERNLARLSQSESEVNGIPSSALFALKSRDATLSAFKNKLQNKQVIHLSTHARSNTDSFPPRIEFIDSSLFLPHLYTMQIPVDLVVLSACESNLGAYAKGEGVMSLSRGFAYAGAESMIASLWAVNESSTAQLFGSYYTHLKEHTKADALTTAKINYLQSPEVRDRYKAPYYWAGFVFTGKDGPLEIGNPSFFQWWMVLVVVLVLGVFLYLKSRK